MASTNSIVIGKNAVASANSVAIGYKAMWGILDWEKIPHGIPINPIILLTHQHKYVRDFGKLLLENPIKDLVIVSAKKGPNQAGIYFILGKLSWKIDQLTRVYPPRILLVEFHSEKGSREYRLTTVKEIYQTINSNYRVRRIFSKLKAVYVNIGEVDESETS